MIPKPGQDHDVDLGVAEEPEEVLPQQRRAALGRVEEVRAEVAVGEQHRHRARRSTGSARISRIE